MPTVRKIGALRFFFYSEEGREPPHIHVQMGDAFAKFWLTPVSLARPGRWKVHELRRVQDLVRSISTSSSGPGEITSMAITDPRADRVEVQQGFLIVDLVDGRRLSVPVEWFPRLSTASQAQRDAWELMDEGRGIRWASIDEDISVAGLLRGGRDTSKRVLGRPGSS